jgi:hypothetical protein
MPTPKNAALSQATTLAASSETTIVTADPNFRNCLTQLVITTAGAAAATLTLRDATAGTIRAIFDYPNAAVAPSSPLVINFDPPLAPTALNNQAWTIQNSVTTATHITASFVSQ